MRPYFAVVADSFRAALSSKVLWVAFASIWIILALLAPAGIRENLTSTFASYDFANATRLKALLADALVNPNKANSPTQRIALALPSELQSELRRVGNGEEVRIRYDEFSDGLNALFDDQAWYDADAWKSGPRSAEQIRFENQPAGQLSPDQLRRLTRLRIESVLPGVFGARTPTSIRPTYAGLDFPADLPLDRQRFTGLVNQLVLPTIIKWLLGFVLIFLGIVVTAPIIPGMLQPGSLHLLLSKPITRTGLLLAKFVGACAFMLLCVIQLVIGLYLIAGLRLDVWNIRLLWCIPASVFLFSVFYSVSMLAGLIFRSEVLSIGITCGFGGLCLVSGIIGSLFDGFVTGRDTVAELTVLGDTVLAITSSGALNRWDPDDRGWVSLFGENQSDGDRILSPIGIESPAAAGTKDSDSLPVTTTGTAARGSAVWTALTAKSSGGRFNAYGLGAFDMLAIPIGSQTSDALWVPQPTVRLPTATSSLYLLPDSQVGALNSTGLYAIDQRMALRPAGEPDQTNNAAANDDSDSASDLAESSGKPSGGSGDWFAKLSQMMGRPGGEFRSVLPTDVSVTPPRRIDVDEASGHIVVASGGRLWRLEPSSAATESTYAVSTTGMMPGETYNRFQMVSTRKYLVIVRDGSGLAVYDKNTLQPINLPAANESTTWIELVAMANDRVLTIDSTGAAVVHDCGDIESPPTPVSMSDCEQAAIGGDGQLYLVHDVDQISVLDPQSLQVTAELNPTLSIWRKVDRYLVSPLRMVIPQTGELGDVISTAISGKSSILMGNPADDDTPIGRYNLVRPLVSCGGFLIVMTIISGFYFGTRDF